MKKRRSTANTPKKSASCVRHKNFNGFRRGATVAKNRDKYRRRYSEAELAKEQKSLAKLYKKISGKSARRRNGRHRLPVGICQYRAARVANWLIEKGSARFEKAVAKGYLLFAVSVVHPEGMIPTRNLDAAVLRKSRRRIQRHQRARLPGAFGLGAIDISTNPGPEGEQDELCSVHEHFLLAMKSSDSDGAKRLIRRAFAGPKHPAIHKRVVVKAIHDLEGWLDYCARPLLISGLVTRSSYLDEWGDRNARDQQLKGWRRRAIVEGLLRSRPEDRVLLIGLRRVGRKLVRTK